MKIKIQLGKCVTDIIVNIPKTNDGKNNSEPYAVTQTISKKSDLQFNEEFTLPFYCFNAINLLFWEKKLGKVKTFASAKLPLTLETFLKHQPQTTDIELFEVPLLNSLFHIYHIYIFH